MGRKMESIKLLQAMDLNTPDCVELRNFDEFAEHIGGLRSRQGEPARRSFRTDQHDPNRMTPHYPNAAISEDLIVKLSEHLMENLTILSAVPIDPAWSLYVGNLHYLPRTTLAPTILEWREGPGTVRDMESKGPEHSLELAGHWPNWEAAGVPPEFITLFKAVKVLKDFGMEDHILEWSLLDRPIGTKLEPWIFWELRRA